MIDHEIDRVTSAIHRLRPDWPIKQLNTLIRDNLADRPRRDVAVALTWIACDTATTTPYRVLESGPWWIAVAVDGQTTGRTIKYDPLATCGICGKDEGFCRRTEERLPADIRHGLTSTVDVARRARKHQETA
jgi:hypothetical protein